METDEKLEICIDALKKLLVPKGAYSLDKFEHARNTIKETAEIAKKALLEIGEMP